MKIMLEKGDRVKLLPAEQLMEVFQRRNFFADNEIRQRFANQIGGKEGVVEIIEEKYAFDYFYFRPDDTMETYSIPYQSIMGVRQKDINLNG
jgi:hypothetical protein